MARWAALGQGQAAGAQVWELVPGAAGAGRALRDRAFVLCC